MDKKTAVEYIGSIGSDLHLNKFPGAESVYAKIRGYSHEYSTVDDWLSTDQIEMRYLKHEGFVLVCPKKYFKKWQDGIGEQNVTNCISNVVCEGDNVFDIGAHIGRHTLTFRRCVGQSGTVTAFEPIPLWQQYLNETVLENNFDNVAVEQLAVTSKSGMVELAIPHPETSQARVSNQSKNDTIITIPSETIEGYLRKSEADSVDVAKIDIEGGEFDIICNSNAIEYISILVVEIHPHLLDDSEEQEIINTLNEFGEITELDGRTFSFEDTPSESTYHILWRSGHNLK